MITQVGSNDTRTSKWVRCCMAVDAKTMPKSSPNRAKTDPVDKNECSNGNGGTPNSPNGPAQDPSTRGSTGGQADGSSDPQDCTKCNQRPKTMAVMPIETSKKTQLVPTEI